MSAPKTIPIPAIENAKAKPDSPSSGLFGSLKVFRSNIKPTKVSAVKPPRWKPLAIIPRIAST